MPMQVRISYNLIMDRLDTSEIGDTAQLAVTILPTHIMLRGQ